MTIRVHQILLFCGISSVFWCFYAFCSFSLSVSFPPLFFFPNNSPPPKTCDINRRPDRFGIFRRTEDQRFMILIRASIYCYLFFLLPSFLFLLTMVGGMAGVSSDVLG
ncbi:hypothetical protein ASPFODRAFT_374891 [Aspergillus luchuensis CBS 106.47]|uniref:Uncharacterized protein n=1 Tax=Aspergillus luchuensis (strain CBS 106.47) TaxID=1137211 RepID=A0A1M3T414_ASPLC|nr:hypothetical protein ASPFODRAFT_374891 [Aspergillus luchuensis CBS 106.47]